MLYLRLDTKEIIAINYVNMKASFRYYASECIILAVRLHGCFSQSVIWGS
jgi:hypothetical protein